MNDLMQLLEEIRNSNEENGGFTTKEVAGMVGCGEDKARNLVRELLAAGKVRPTRVKRVNMAGIVQNVLGYEIIPETSE